MFRSLEQIYYSQCHQPSIQVQLDKIFHQESRAAFVGTVRGKVPQRSRDVATGDLAELAQKNSSSHARTSVGSRIVALAIEDNKQNLSAYGSKHTSDISSHSISSSVQDLYGAISLAKIIGMHGDDDKLVQRLQKSSMLCAMHFMMGMKMV